MSTSSRLLVMKPSTSGTGSASVTSTTGARPKKRTQNRRFENADRTINLDSDTNSPSTSQQSANLANSGRKVGPKSQSRKKLSLTNRQNRSGYNNNMRRSSSSGTSTAGSPKKRKKGKSLKQQLRETVLDESADWRQRFRQGEEKNRKLHEKLLIKKQAIQSQKEEHRREIKSLNESFNGKIGQETDRHFKEKTKIEKELRSMTKRAEKAELDLIKAESVKTVQSGSGEALFQDMLGNLKEFLDGQLQCSICNEIYVYSSVISCGHTFCEDCIEGWKKKQPNTTCPICRSDIIITCSNQVMDSFIEKFVDNFFPDDAKKARNELIADRKAKKDAREAKHKNKPILSAGTRRRILNLESDNNDDDSDSDFGLMFRLPDLDSPTRYSTASSVASSLSRNRDDMLSTPNWSEHSEVEYNFSSDSDSDNSYQPGQVIEDVDLSLLDVLEPIGAAFNIDAEDSDDHFSHDDEEDGNNDTDADDAAVTPNEDSTDEDDSDDDDDDNDENDELAEVRFEFPGNTGWPAFSDSD